MGGLPSQAWADAANKAYEAGIVVVCAAGNNFGGLPTSLVVYPARFDRVIAACGVMADKTPYLNLPPDTMERARQIQQMLMDNKGAEAEHELDELLSKIGEAKPKP